MNEIKLQLGKALELMSEIPDDSVALILCKLPHAVDGLYDLDEIEAKYPIQEFWTEAHRCLTPHGCVVVFGGQEPTTSWIRNSNPERYRYDWIIDFKHPFDHYHAYKGRNVPLRRFEPINVFSERTPRFYPQQLHPTKFGKPEDELDPDFFVDDNDHGVFPEPHSHTHCGLAPCDEHPHFFPENILEIPMPFHSRHHNHHLEQGQYPLPLLEYLIKTYTVKGEMVVDPFSGLGNTGLACIETQRSFIGIEENKDLFVISRNRLDKACQNRSSIFFDWEDRRSLDELPEGETPMTKGDSEEETAPEEVESSSPSEAGGVENDSE